VALATALESGQCKLTWLELYQNCIGDAGVVALAKALESGQCKLKYLCLTRNRFGDAGAVALAKALESEQCTLERLKVSQNSIGDAAYGRLDVAMRHCPTARLAAARCRLSLAMGFVPRLCEDNLLANCPIDCISKSASYCTTQLVLRFLMAQSTERSGTVEELPPSSLDEEGVPPVHVSGL
jgi:Ran GTPase-activating protein (RanGAP) involved in mRNA processing and transport